jgi:hypothetical protein
MEIRENYFRFKTNVFRMLRRVFSDKFTDVSEVPTASSKERRVLTYSQQPTIIKLIKIQITNIELHNSEFAFLFLE